MSKRTSLLIVYLSVLLQGLTFSRPLLADTNNIGGLTQDIDVPVCYMETANGRIFDLSRLCRTQPETTSKCISGAAGLPVSQVSYDGNALRGQVTNRTCNPIKLVKVNYQVLDTQGNQIDNGFIYAEPSTIPPGQTASFAETIVSGAKVNVTHVEWSDS